MPSTPCESFRLLMSYPRWWAFPITKSENFWSKNCRSLILQLIVWRRNGSMAAIIPLLIVYSWETLLTYLHKIFPSQSHQNLKIPSKSPQQQFEDNMTMSAVINVWKWHEYQYACSLDTTLDQTFSGFSEHFHSLGFMDEVFKSSESKSRVVSWASRVHSSQRASKVIQHL
jgi:hypothetical protein